MVSAEGFIFGEGPSTEIGRTSVWEGWQHQLGDFLSSLLGPDAEWPSIGATGIEQMSLVGLQGMFGPEGIFAQQQQTMRGMMEGGKPGVFDASYQEDIVDPMMKTFQQDVLPGLRAEMAPAYWGSQRLGQEEAATEDLLDSLVGQRTGLRESALDRAMTASQVGMSPILQAMQMASQMSLGPEMREYGMFTDRLQMILAALGLEPYSPYAISQGGTEGALSGVLSGLASGAGKAMMGG